MKLNRSNKKHLSYARAEAPPPSKAHIATRIVYITLLLLITGYIAYQIVRYTFFVNEFGIVTRNTLPLTSTHGGRISSLLISESEMVDEGDIIALISNLDDCQRPEDTRIEKLSFEIAAEKLELETLRKQHNLLQQRQSTQPLMRALEINRSLFTDQASNEHELKKLALEISQKEQKINLDSLRLDALEELHQARLAEQSCGIEKLIAPYDGQIVSISRWPLEVIESRATVAEMVPHDARTEVSMSINFDLFDAIRVGDSYRITFPDGKTDTAIVNSIQSTLKQNNNNILGELLSSQKLQVKLIPSPNSKLSWADYYRMAVRVEGIK